MNKIFYILLISYLGQASVALAQQHPDHKQKTDSIQVNKLNQVNVNGKRTVKLKKDTLSNTLKLQQPLLQIPQNIVNISSGLLQQQGALELKDAARNASGFYFGYNSTPFDNSAVIQIRGFSAFSTLNGMSRRFSYGASIDDEALIENVEFIKGPAGFITSAGEPGGTINIVTKTPNHKLFNIQQTAGSFNLYRMAVDIGSEVQKKGFSYRFNAAYQHRDSYLKDLRTEKYVFAPVLQYNFSPNTFVLAEYDFVRGESENGSAIMKVRSESDYLKGPISINYSTAPGLPISYAQNETGRIYAVHKFNDNWQVTSQTSYLSAPYTTWNMTSKGSMVNFGLDGTTKRRASLVLGTGKTFSSQLFANGNLKTAGIKHQLLFGADYTNSRDSLSLNNGKIEFSYNKANPVNAVDPDLVRQTTRTIKINNNTYLKSVFLYDNIQLQKQFLLTLGGRYTWYTNDRVNTTAKGKGTPQKYDQKAFSPRAALTFLADAQTSLFFLYDQSFVPQSGQRAIVDPGTRLVTGTESVDPQRGNDFELGIKRNWFNSKLNMTLNGFHTIKTNVLVSDLENDGYVKQIGQVTSNGVELDILGHINDNLSIVANYTFVKAKISKDNDPELIGKALPQTPQQIFNTWLQYGFSLKNDAKLSLSVGQVTQIKRSTSEKDIYIPNYTKFDAGLSYTQERYFFRLIADNLTGKRYMSTGDVITGYPYEGKDYYYIDGEPFNVKVSFGVKF